LEFSVLTHSLLIGMAFVAGFISSIAGSGGLLVLPALLAAGVPPLHALATNKFQSVFGTLSSSINFFRRGHLDIKALRGALLCTFVGAFGGTFAVQQVNPVFLKDLLPYFLLLLAAYVLVSSSRAAGGGTSGQPKAGCLKPRWSSGRFAVWAGGGIGFYGGFLGPAMGSFFSLAFVGMRRFDLLQATAASKPLVLMANATSMVLFMHAGLVFWPLALTMAVAQIVGVRLGSTMAMRRGSQFIRPVLLVVLVSLSLKLLLFPV